MAGESKVMQGQKETITAQGTIVGEKVTKKGKARDKSVSGDPVVKTEKRLARLALQIAKHQERWQQHPDTVNDIFIICMEQYREELLGTVQRVREEMLGALNEVVDQNDEACQANASFITTLQETVERFEE